MITVVFAKKKTFTETFEDISRKHFRVFQETVLLESRQHLTSWEKTRRAQRKNRQPLEKNDTLIKVPTLQRILFFKKTKNNRPRIVYARFALFLRDSVLRVFGPPQRYAHAHGNTVLDDGGRQWQRTVLCGSLTMDTENWVRQWSVSQIRSIGIVDLKWNERLWKMWHGKWNIGWRMTLLNLWFEKKILDDFLTVQKRNWVSQWSKSELFGLSDS